MSAGPEPGRIRLRRLARRTGPLRRAPEDPLAGMANLADLMLVFAAGLLIALTLAWDLAGALDPDLRGRLRGAREVQDLERAGGRTERELADGAARFRSMGQVYRDTITGRLFIVEEEKR